MFYYSDPQYLDQEFPFNMYENSIPDAKSSLICEDGSYPGNFRMHNHDCLELNYITSGEGIYYIGEEVHPFRKGDVLIFNNFEYHGAVAIRNLRVKVIVFDPNLIWTGNPMDYQYLKTFYEWKTDFRHHLSDSILTEYIATIFFEIQHEWEHKAAGYQLIIKALLMKMLALLYRGFESNEQVSEQISEFANRYEKIAPALNYIGANYSTHIKLETLAQKCHMNPNYFSSYFKTVMNYTPFEYINRKRVEAACQRLLTTDDNVTKIALDVGFHSISYFNRVFKAQMKVSPLSLRSSKQNESADPFNSDE